MTDAVSLYITCADRAEALNLGRSLVEAQLAACANVIDGVTSVFAWEGEIQESHFKIPARIRRPGPRSDDRGPISQIVVLL